jgi:cytosine/adenosine deaminase-related metal-dependent hydrolase
MEQTTYAARWIFPVESAPLPGGAITIVDDRIAAVEPHGTRSPDVDLGNVAILPGFVNAHTHLDLTGARGLCPPSADFTQWLRRVIAFRRTRTSEQVQGDIAAGIAECVRHGTTSIGDIAGGGASWKPLSEAPCRAVVFHELLGLSEERAKQSRQDAQVWLNQHPAKDRCAAGLSPHAPYSVRSILYSVLSASTLPIATHLAETMAELELLRSRRGPFVDFLKELNGWDPGGLIADPLDVIRMLPRGIFVHGNYLDPRTPFLPAQTLVICPRTHAAFGHPQHPFPGFLKHGVRVALGTDSLASNPDLDILAEARFLRRHCREVEPAMLLRMLTLGGAEALGFDSVTGSLTPGKSADLVVLALLDEDVSDPHDLLLQSSLLVRRVMFRGEWTIEPNSARRGETLAERDP